MLITPSITQISILSRGAVPQAEGHLKAKVIVQTDFSTYPPDILSQLKGAEGVVWAQGVSIKEVPKDEYRKIQYEWPLAAAKAFATLSSPQPFKFVYVSGEGATTKPGLFSVEYGIEKGKSEAALLALSKDPAYANLKPFSPRLGVVDYTAHPEIHDFVPKKWKQGMMAVLGTKIVLPALRPTWKGMVSPTRELGKVLTDLAMGDGEPLIGEGYEGEGRTIPNSVLRKHAEL